MVSNNCHSGASYKIVVEHRDLHAKAPAIYVLDAAKFELIACYRIASIAQPHHPIYLQMSWR